MITYRGYDVTRNVLTGEWFADPVTANTTEYRLRAPNRQQMKMAIDAAVSANRNPWELPEVKASPAA
ncbi:hypothetical protein IQ266_25115 [filamentous cyanobacterium LEGE 11480]|uniref:Uncharacterized protein n=1 Tax=Romeriopsis navalis LEGE 11480 TaxID=2777977 RepID=A0A928VQW8_9CYAN|nr:hypothetical protein [Romeriopsis navalis]MBE9033021.1 hypothetical protein [Romeriopsis navalis LEGE 11480]